MREASGPPRKFSSRFSLTRAAPPPHNWVRAPAQRVSMHASQLIGLDVGGTKCALGVESAGGAFAEVARFPTAGPAETLARFAQEIEKLPSAVARWFGVSCGGPLDAGRGVIQSPPNLRGWNDVAICAWLTQQFGAPARLMNDANACALAEWHEGAGRGSRTMVFLTMGTGMGGGIVIDGRLHEGVSGNAGEVGHLRLAIDGPVGFGKAGSFEGFCSGGGIAQLARRRVDEFTGRSVLQKMPPEEIDARQVSAAAEIGDKLGLAVWTEVGTKLGEGLALLVDILNPERIVIGGIYPRAEKFIAPAMRAALAREALAPSVRDCAVVPAALGEQIGSRAAVAIARALAKASGSQSPFSMTQ
jgi:glucokinase